MSKLSRSKKAEKMAAKKLATMSKRLLDDRDGVDSSGGTGTRASEGSVVKFQDITKFEDLFDGSLIDDSGLLVCDQRKYYELCCSQKMFLHGHLMEGLGSKLVTAMIYKTTSIAYAIESVSQFPSPQDFECFDKILKAFEDLGMSVGFLRARIDKLDKISRQYETVEESRNAKNVQLEEKKGALMKKVSTMESLAASIAALKASMKTVEAEMDAFKKESEDLDADYFEVAAAPWS